MTGTHHSRVLTELSLKLGDPGIYKPESSLSSLVYSGYPIRLEMKNMSLGHPELGPSSAAASVGERHLRSDEARCQSRSTMVHWESTLEFPIHPFFRGLGVMPNSVQGIGRVQTPHLSAASKAQRWGVRVLLVMAFRTREWSKRRPRKMSQTFLFSEIMKVRYSIILRKFLKGKMS